MSLSVTTPIATSMPTTKSHLKLVRTCGNCSVTNVQRVRSEVNTRHNFEEKNQLKNHFDVMQNEICNDFKKIILMFQISKGS